MSCTVASQCVTAACRGFAYSDGTGYGLGSVGTCLNLQDSPILCRAGSVCLDVINQTWSPLFGELECSLLDWGPSFEFEQSLRDWGAHEAHAYHAMQSS